MNQYEKQFVKWIARNEPKLARAAKAKVERDATMGDLGAGFFTGFTDAIKELLPAVVSEKTRRDNVKVAIAQAQNSQPIITNNTSTGYTIPEPVKWAGGAAAVVTAAVLLKKLFTRNKRKG